MSFIALDVRGGRLARGLRHHRNCFAYLGDAARLMSQITRRVTSQMKPRMTPIICRFPTFNRGTGGFIMPWYLHEKNAESAPRLT